MNSENRVKAQDCPVHDWYRFILSFPPHLVQEYIEKFRITKNDIVLDPFCGTGTTNVECKKNGISSIGIEASPITYFVSSTKCNWIPNIEQILEEAEQIAIKASYLINNSNGLRVLSEEQGKLLLSNSISERPLNQVLILRDVICKANTKYQDYFLLALAKHIVFSYSNLKFGPEVGIVRKKVYDADIVPIWLNQIEIMQHDLHRCFGMIDVSTQIFNSDSRAINTINLHKKINFVITSPPYPNEKDYSRTTRLESVLLGFIKNKDELRAIKQRFIRSNTKNVYKDDDDYRYIDGITSISDLSDTIERKRIELKKTSGFEKLYSKVVRLYFGGMAKHLISMKSILAPNAKLAYVVGDQASYFKIPIQTAKLLSEVAEHVGYQVEGIEPFRRRYATATDTWLNENVLILKYLGY